MRKHNVFLLCLAAALFACVSCGTLPISDEAIEVGVEGARRAVETVSRPAFDLLYPGLGGLAGAIGTAAAIGLRALLKGLQKKRDEHLREVVKG